MFALAHHRILVLEDSDEDFDTALQAASEVGLGNALHRAATGSACLDMLAAAEPRPASRPAVLLLDLNTPGLDGREALVLIRATPALKTMPIVVLSTSDDPRDVAHCYANGANAYHVKPFNHRAHLDLLRELFAYWTTIVVLPDDGGGLP